MKEIRRIENNLNLYRNDELVSKKLILFELNDVSRILSLLPKYRRSMMILNYKIPIDLLVHE